ncbi:MAG: deaminase [Acidobacteriota bacterium]|nr:deaminase [Acidobacteriota bacterium]
MTSIDTSTLANMAAERDVELVFALAGPVGTDLPAISRLLSDALKKCEYDAAPEIRLSNLIKKIAVRQTLKRADGSNIELVDSPEEKRIHSYMDGGNAIRRMCGDNAALASAAIAEVIASRGSKPSRRAYILRSVKRADEVNLLRRVYGPGFFLIGVNMRRSDRVKRLASSIAASHGETTASPNFANYQNAAELLARRDEEEEDPYGQRLREVFQLADLFLSVDVDEGQLSFDEIYRFLRLILGDLGETPRPEEQFMFHAFAASLASGALGRQVGAILTKNNREIVGAGWNDVPRGGGGLYRAGDHLDERDIKRDRDSTNEHADRMLEELADAAEKAGWLAEGKRPSIEEARRVLRKSGIMNLLEFGRTTHAEMEAVLSAARVGVSVRDVFLYTTTFPCHECARLIITAGIRRVIFIEPYQKSRALELHGDAIVGYDAPPTESCEAKDCSDLHYVEFSPFVGIGPRRFGDLFSLITPSGIRLERKTASGERKIWSASAAIPKVQMLPLSYLDLEQRAVSQLEEMLSKSKS